MLSYEFMRKAFIVGGLLALIIPLIGANMVFKRLSLLGDALSHVSLSGVTIGLIIGINPVLSAILTTIVAAIVIEIMRVKLKRYQELSLAIILSFGVGLAGFLLKYVSSGANFESFLFGSIVTISNFELWLIVALSSIILLVVFWFYRAFFFVAFDELAADLSGINVKLVNYAFTILIAITVALASRTVGVLVVSSLMVLPVATAGQLAKSYRHNLIMAMFFGLLSVWSGIILAYYFDFKPGGTIVLLGVGLLIITLAFTSIKKK